MDDRIFALDIGTRKIIGLIMEKKENGYEVLDAEMIEHQTRAMMDGQIHDVEAVAQTILIIKKRLEERLGVVLHSAAVAAAGRALKTTRGRAEKSSQQISEITRDEVRALEIAAVQQAQQVLARDEMDQQPGSEYFCVGYSLIASYLENQQIGSLVGQLGSHTAVEVIATFLPRVVVDSLFSALKHAGLDVYSMTLEPIAAISLAIPANMRLLNLALVDIGAGTSDIAVVKNGNIFAYAMVPFGGDELTERLANYFLMDFNSAESLKCMLSSQETLRFKDILDNQIDMESKEIKAILEPTVRELAAQITTNILELNAKTTDAVLCVGGGSLTPQLIDLLAESMQVPRNRVGLRTRENSPQIMGDFACLKGPQAVTPLGIAYHSFEKPPVPFIKVTVNGREIALWNIGEIDVADALLSAGISLNNVYGKPGMGKTLEINGYLQVFKGEMGTAPTIRVNKKEANLDTHVKNGDKIEFKRGQDGADACVKLTNIDAGGSGYINVNGERLELSPVFQVNGQDWSENEEIPDRAQVSVHRVNQLVDILAKASLPAALLQEKTYNYFVNDQPMIVKWNPLKLIIDGQPARFDQIVNFGACIEYSVQGERPRIKDLIPLKEAMDCVVTVNGQKVSIKSKGFGLKRNGTPVSPDDEIFNGARITVDREQGEAILSDIFQVVDIKAKSNGRLRIRLNGEEAGYTTPITHNSVIELAWE